MCAAIRGGHTYLPPDECEHTVTLKVALLCTFWRSALHTPCAYIPWTEAATCGFIPSRRSPPMCRPPLLSPPCALFIPSSLSLQVSVPQFCCWGRGPPPPPLYDTPCPPHRYQRDMVMLKMQIEKARGEAELQQIRSTLNQMRASGVGGPGVECGV